MGHRAGGTPGIRKTDDLEAIRRFSLEAGLEDGTFEKIIATYGYYVDDELAGCASLKKDGDWYAVEWLAVADGLRGKGIGSMLVRKIETEAKMRGAERLWALARAPRFFEKIGFRQSAPSDRPEGPTLSNCLLCKQYQRDCFPAIMVKNL
jgi:N-acetylglutamate synthase-like GNAT family acetyltransferase